MLAGLGADVARDYPPGALPWALGALPLLAARFYNAERRLDALANGSPTAKDWGAALGALRAVLREINEAWRDRVATAAAGCAHVADRDLADFYRDSPRLECARCWLRRGRD